MLQAGIALLKDNKGLTGASTVLLVLILTAYIAQDGTINELSLELGEKRSDARHYERALADLTENCFNDQ